VLDIGGQEDMQGKWLMESCFHLETRQLIARRQPRCLPQTQAQHGHHLSSTKGASQSRVQHHSKNKGNRHWHGCNTTMTNAAARAIFKRFELQCFCLPAGGSFGTAMTP